VAVQLAREEAPPGPTDDVIRTVGLTKVFRAQGGRLGGGGGEVRAVEGLDLAVRRGEIFGLLGPNGAGKTTTVGMLTTRVVPTSGRASVGGIDVVARPALAKQVIGVVPQTNTLDRSLDVYENLYFHGRYFGMRHGRARAVASELLERFRLADRARAEVDELSGGMAQRLMVARAVMHGPRILFLDEPTAGLDPQSRIALWDVVRELHAQGQTILLTTHYMEEADQLCDRVAIMDRGRLLTLDTPARLKTTVGTSTEVRVQATGDAHALVSAFTVLAGVEGARVVDERVHVYVRTGGPSLPELIAHADRVGVHVTDIGVTEPSLETVFIALTGKDLRE
jgi:ABC-2 type transport system ATP-binding protein